MELTVGANQFFWPAERWARFYEELASSPIDRVVHQHREVHRVAVTQ